MKKPSFGIIYEFFLAGLVIFSLVVDLPEPYGKALDLFIWGIFLIDYIIRLSLSRNKWTFIKNHPLDLIAIIPLDQIFRTARLVRLVRVIRLLSVLMRKGTVLDQFFAKYKMDRLFVSVLFLLFLAALSMKWIEPSFDSYGDALWWAVVTTTTVGYGDLYPETTAGRIIASVLMFVGIGMIGIVTGTVASAFNKHDEADLPSELKYVKTKINEYPSLTDEELAKMIGSLEKFRTKTDINNEE